MVNSAQKDEDEHINNATFTYPMEPDGMYEAAEVTILYYINNPQVQDTLKKSLQHMVDESASVYPGNPDKAGQMISSTLIIGRVFHSLITEKPVSSTDTATITEIAASLCFYQQSGTYRIYHADRCSKRLASLLAVLRAGCCTALKAEVPSSTSYEVDASNFMKEIRSGDTNSRIAQSVGHFRRLHDRTTFSNPPTTENERGDVCIGNLVFEIQILNNLIPTVNKICEEAISDIIVDDTKRWKEVLDVRNRLEVYNSGGVISFKIIYPGGTAKKADDIIPASTISAEGLDRKAGVLIGAVMAFLQGFGGGPPRGRECLRTGRADLQYSGDYFFFETVVNKPQSKSVKVRRQLPASSSALMAMVLYLLPEGRDGCMFDRSMKDVDKLVGTTWAKAFGHSRPVGFHDSRQLFAYNLNRLKKEYVLLNFDEPGKVSSADRTCTCTCHVYFWS